VHGAGIAGFDAETCAQAIAEGAVLGTCRFRRYKDTSNGDDPKEIETLTIVESDESKLDAIRRGIERGRIMGEAANHTRDMANEPANALPPAKLAERAQSLAQDAGLECEVWDEKQLEKLGMGGVLGVGSGSTNPPRFIILKYRGGTASASGMALIGKGITFDSGGISIKPAAGMEAMKGDMSRRLFLPPRICRPARPSVPVMSCVR
jgi:leucyl aminopeptidase